VTGLLPAISQVCTFRIGSAYLGIEVLDVQEVLFRADVTWVPRAERGIYGLINLRGQIATAIDIGMCLGLSRSGAADPVHVVIRHGGESVSLVVDKIGDVLTLDPELVDPPPVTLDESKRALLRGAYQLDDDLLLIVDIRRVLSVRSELLGTGRHG